MAGDDAQQLEAFYLEHRAALFAVAMTLTGCPDRAEDAVHEAFSRIVRNGGASRSLKAYVFRAVRNAAIDQRRSHPPQTEVPPDLFDPAPSPRQSAADAEFTARVRSALAKLESDTREIVIQRLFAEMTFREIAEAMDLPLGTVTTKWRRAMMHLRRALEELR